MSKIFLPKAFKSEKAPLSKAFFSLGSWIQGQLDSGELNAGSLPATVQGDILYASGTDTITKLAKSATATRYLSNTGTSNNPAWAQVNLANGVTGELPTDSLPTNLQTYNGVKRYVALLSQSGTSAPTAEVLENTLGGTVVWSYDGVGSYLGTLTGAFPGNKTITLIESLKPTGKVISTSGAPNFVAINTTNNSDVAANNILNVTSISISVYP